MHFIKQSTKLSIQLNDHSSSIITIFYSFAKFYTISFVTECL